MDFGCLSECLEALTIPTFEAERKERMLTNKDANTWRLTPSRSDQQLDSINKFAVSRLVSLPAADLKLKAKNVKHEKADSD